MKYKFNGPLPHNNEAEQSIIGAMLIDPKASAFVLSEVDAGDFFTAPHVLIYKTIEKMQASGFAVDMVTLAEQLRREGALDTVGGPAYLAELSTVLPLIRNVREYCRIIKTKSAARRLITSAVQMVETCHKSESIEEMTDAMSKTLLDVSGVFSTKRRPEREAEVTKRVIEKVEENAKLGDISGVPTGIADLDSLTWGMQKTDLIILAGRPGMGKTTMALNLINYAASRGYNTALFSMEMSKEQLVMKMLSDRSGIRLRALQRGDLGDSMWPRLIRAAGAAMAQGRGTVIIDDTPALTSAQLRNRAKMISLEHDINLIVIDYLQLMRGSAENRTQEISEISRSLKALAKELEVPVIALSQLNRSLEQRADKRPVMSDLRESGAIEQDADIVMFIYRDEVYNKNEQNPNKGIAELIIGKYRHGSTGVIQLYFDPECGQFKGVTQRVEMQ